MAGLDKIALAAALAKLAQTAAKTKELKNIVKRVKELFKRTPKAGRPAKDILNPGGRLYGRKGKRPDVRIAEGGEKAAYRLFMVMAIPDGVDERELIDSPEMEAIRKKAAEALRLVRASTYEGSTVEIVEE